MMTPYGNFEFLLDFEHYNINVPGLIESYLNWRNKICEQFPHLDLIKQFNLEEKLAVKKAALARYQMGASMRSKISEVRQSLGFFESSEKDNSQSALISKDIYNFDPSANHQIENEMREIEKTVKELKQQRTGLH